MAVVVSWMIMNDRTIAINMAMGEPGFMLQTNCLCLSYQHNYQLLLHSSIISRWKWNMENANTLSLFEILPRKMWHTNMGSLMSVRFKKKKHVFKGQEWWHFPGLSNSYCAGTRIMIMPMIIMIPLWWYQKQYRGDIMCHIIQISSYQQVVIGFIIKSCYLQ